MIPDEIINRVRESADIVQIIGAYVNLKRRGSDYRGPCPFHQGKNPNFSVSPSRAMYHCFKCQESGNVFTFLQKHSGLSFPDAVRAVAQTTGIEIPDTSRESRGPDPREPLWEINSLAAEYFKAQLWQSQAAQAARDYLQERGITRDIADTYGLGFAPREIGVFRAHMETLGFDQERLLDAGLMSKRDDNSEPRPRFRNRLIFPIYDIGGNCVAFGGRALGDVQPKYLNSPETRAFSKRKTLYALNWTRNDIRKEDRAFVVEGYFDAIRLMTSGFNVTVAPLGTALTDEQAELVSRYSKNVYLMYDSDQAGLKATFRAGDELLKFGCSVRVVTLPPDSDPDSLVASGGAEALEEYLASSIDIFERKLQILERGGWFAELQKKRQALDRILPTLRAASDPLLKDLYISRTAEKTGIAKDVLMRELDSDTAGFEYEQEEHFTPPPSMSRVRTSSPAERPRRRRRALPSDGAERAVIMVLIADPNLLPEVEGRISADHIHDDEYREIFEGMVELGAGFNIEALAQNLSDEAVDVLNVATGEIESVTDLKSTLDHAISQMMARSLRDKLSEIDSVMPLATDAEQDQLLRQKVRLANELKMLGEPMSKHDKLWKGIS